MSRVNAAFWDDVRRLAHDECMRRALTMMDAADGMGNHNLTPAQVVERFMDYAADGTLDALPGIGRQDLQDTLIREYREALARSPLAGPPTPSPEIEAQTMAEVLA